MAYVFANRQEVKEAALWCEGILKAVQTEVNDYFTFDFRLIGSGDRKLVTQNGDEPFDLDYDIILQRDKKELLNDPKRIKELFRNKLDVVLKNSIDKYKPSPSRDSTSVLTTNVRIDNRISFSFDVAIIAENDNGHYCRITNVKDARQYIWNQLPNSNGFHEKFKAIKDAKLWNDFKAKYLKKKNEHLSRQTGVNSFSILLETINEFYR